MATEKSLFISLAVTARLTASPLLVEPVERLVEHLFLIMLGVNRPLSPSPQSAGSFLFLNGKIDDFIWLNWGVIYAQPFK